MFLIMIVVRLSSPLRMASRFRTNLLAFLAGALAPEMTWWGSWNWHMLSFISGVEKGTILDSWRVGLDWLRNSYLELVWVSCWLCPKRV